MKMKQVPDAFQDILDPDIKKCVCAPCSNCKGQIRDMFNYYEIWENYNISYGGLAELVVNAVTDIREPYIRWERH